MAEKVEQGGGLVSGNKAGITFVVMVAALMALVDITIVNVALNDIRASFGTPVDQIGWVSTGYMMANIVVIPMTGWFQRRFGFRRYFAASIFIFTVASALCGLSWNLTSLVMFRALQGLGGGAIIPTAQTILFARYPKEQHGMAGGLFGLGAVTGPLLGPTVGGYLIDWSTWHWCFLVNVPLGVLAVVLALRFIEEPGFKPSKAPIDAFGISLLAVGMACLQYVLEEGNRESWFESTHITVLFAIAITALVTFIVHELETPHPVVDLRVFLNRTYAAGTGINLLMGLALFSGNFLFALYCGSVLHYAALDIGRVFLLSGASQIILMPLVGKFGGKVDQRALLLIGIAGVATSLWMNAHLTDQAGEGDLVQSMFVRSVSLAFVFIPISVIALSDISAEKRGNATGLFNLTRELGGSIGTAWMGSLIDRGSKIHGSYLAESVNPYNPIVQETIGSIRGSLGTMTSSSELVPESVLAVKVKIQAMVLSFQDGFKSATAVFLGCLVLLLFLKKAKGGPVAGAH
ncbi:Drug resistance transporter EmrB/QacA subfamily [Labilithrix luteola]|uniref:Drug resistance transporter EmrB/QacA subfamily n=1 Tax=Labilithrix luteola TaxID=1391654 RepID=A0A0K1PW05_9BACT|nr:DHA2 family efflux MFS transporter permease subunit [Labilithrix luteola]AKU97576.1 Drug resistance transporter EmrB/QacA subfamily [Labilithrix luteola]